jgi:CBS domain-containing protein
MSPRAAWRFEGIGYDVYHHVTGKADWLAAGPPTEGRLSHAPRVIAVADRGVPTCRPDEAVRDLLARAAGTGEVCIVTNEAGVVLGRLRLDGLDSADTRRADDVMDPGPATVRADADLRETTERMHDRRVRSLIVSTPDGVLLGLLRATSPEAGLTGVTRNEHEGGGIV